MDGPLAGSAVGDRGVAGVATLPGVDPDNETGEMNERLSSMTAACAAATFTVPGPLPRPCSLRAGAGGCDGVAGIEPDDADVGVGCCMTSEGDRGRDAM